MEQRVHENYIWSIPSLSSLHILNVTFILLINSDLINIWQTDDYVIIYESVYEWFIHFPNQNENNEYNDISNNLKSAQVPFTIQYCKFLSPSAYQ